MTQIRQIERGAPLPKTYRELVAVLPPRPISDKVAYANATDMVDTLAGLTLNADQEDYLDILSDLIETYEDEHAPKLPKISGIKLLQHLLDENGLAGEDLASLLKVDRSVAYKILKGTRSLTTVHVRRVCDRFKVGPELFI